MAIITIGNPAINQPTSSGGGNTYIDKNNAADGTGKITQANIYVNSEMTGVKFGTFFGSGTTWENRDFASLGTLSVGLNEVTVDINVETGDFIGIFFSGNVDRINTGGIGYNSKVGDQFTAGEQTYFNVDDRIQSFGGEGATISVGFTRKIKISGTFQDKPIKTKVAGTFVDKPIKIKVGGTFQDA